MSRGDVPLLIAVARVRSTHGVKGFLKIAAYSGNPETLKSQKQLRIGNDESDAEIFKLESIRPTTADNMLVKLEGIDSIEEAEALKGLTIFVPEHDLPALPELTYYSYQLEGCSVFLENGALLGEVYKVENLPANDVIFVKRKEGTEVLIPATKDIIRSIDLTARRIVVEDRKGLV